ncbi:hypothetical protein ACQ4PT_000899 [Festuca glaucescens]
MAAILRRTTAKAAAELLPRPPRGAGWLARFLGDGASAASHGNTGVMASAAEFVPWRNGGGVLHRAASVDPTAVVEAGAVVHSGAVIGKEVVVGSGTVVGPSVSVGQSTRIGWRDTIIGDATKIDNLVQIGHNVVIGKCCMICGQVGIAGSATLGDYVTLGGRVAIRDHVSIASKVRLAANSLATKDIQNPGDYGGFPAVPVNEWRWQTVNLRLLSKKHVVRR